MIVGGNCLKYLKRGEGQKRQEDFNRDGKLGQGLGGVKKKGGGGAGTPS